MTAQNCIYCGKVRYNARPDQLFCDNICRAAYYREFGAGGSHAPKYRVHSMRCEHCGDWTDFNDYADRGGKRRKKYCSDKCRQAAHRARQKANASSGGQQQRESKRQENARQGAKTGHKTRDKEDTRWDGRDWWVVLGVDRFCVYGQARDAWRALCLIYHPDKAGGDLEKMQKINAAWDKAKRHFGR